MNQPVKPSLRSTNQLRKPSSWVTQPPESGYVQRGAVAPWLRPNADRMTWRPNDPNLRKIPETSSKSNWKWMLGRLRTFILGKKAYFRRQCQGGDLEPWTFFGATWKRRQVKDCWNSFENCRYFPLDSTGTNGKVGITLEQGNTGTMSSLPGPFLWCPRKLVNRY